VQTAGSGSIVDRVMGILRLNVPTYEEVERDQSATTQAAIIVGVVAVASGIGALGGDEGSSALRILFGVASAFLGWFVYSAVAYVVGTKMLPGQNTSATIGELLRTLGFAYAPNVLGVLGILGAIGGLFVLIGFIWFVVCAVIALRQALEMSTGRAIAVGIVSIIGYIIVLIPLGLILGVSGAYGT
jgi:hypothetical protein